MRSVLKGKNLPLEYKFFPVLTFIETGGKEEMIRVALTEGVGINLKRCLNSFST